MYFKIIRKKYISVDVLTRLKFRFGLTEKNIVNNEWRIKIRDVQILNAITQTLIHSNRYMQVPQFEELHDTVRQQLIHYLSEDIYQFSGEKIVNNFTMQDLLDCLNIENKNKPIASEVLNKFNISERDN